MSTRKGWIETWDDTGLIVLSFMRCWAGNLGLGIENAFGH